MHVCENALIAKLLSELDAAGLQEQFGVSRFAGFYSHGASYLKKHRRCRQGSIFINYTVDFSSQK